MPATFLADQPANASGLNPAYTAADLVNGNSYIPAVGRFLLVKNAGGSPVNLTLVTPGVVDGNAIADKVVSVPIGSVPIVIAPSRAEAYADGATGQVTFTSAAALSVAVVSA
jgi:hypothetical protein